MKAVKDILFIINPKSGHGKGERLAEKLQQWLANEPVNAHYFYLQGELQTKRLRSMVLTDYDVVVAAGGDGTLHEVGNLLANTAIPMGIIPLGSGNGIARSFGIPLGAFEALQLILSGQAKAIDLIKVNEQFLIGVGGLGFDAQVAKSFEQLSHRGLMGYVKAVFRDLTTYQNKPVSIQLRKQMHEVNGYFLAICNTAQYGNNAFVSPASEPSDGKMELAWIENLHPIEIPFAAILMFTKSLRNLNKYRNISTTQAVIQNPHLLPLHLDGEVYASSPTLHLQICRAALYVLI